MDVLWQPALKDIQKTQLSRFLEAHWATDHNPVGRPFDYAAAHRWSVEDPGRFWSAVWAFCGVVGEAGSTPLAPGAGMRDAEFFPEARLNYAENCLAKPQAGPALIAWGEGKPVRQMGWAELDIRVRRFAGWLKAQGVQPGDRVAAVMPNCPETVIAALGAAALGAVFSSASPDFGEAALLDRFGQIEPKVLVACDGYFYNGKKFPIQERVAALRAEIASIAAVVQVPYLDLPLAEGAVVFDAAQRPGLEDGFAFERLPFDHPLFILFSSGTTGKPKCIVHGAGGTLLQHVKEHRLHSDIRPGDRFFYFTTCGWMMWNWLLTGLASGATLLLYDGSPFYPDGRRLFDYVQDQQATFFGTSAKWIDAVKKAGLVPRQSHHLSHVRTMASTGSPLAPESFDFVYESIKADLHLASISGGTDIVSCFVLGNPCGPVRRGEIQAPGLGMAVEVWSEDGQPVVGERGELVCTQPFPSMPVQFWDDPDGARYSAAYFETFPGIWCHGDFAIQTEHGGFMILGRSDTTLNPQGVRIGTAEIYRQVEQIPDVLESLAVGQDWDDDTRVVLFVVLRAGAKLTEALEKDIKTRIRTGASPRHVPAVIVAVADLPRTKSGKISEKAVQDVIHGRAVKNTGALANAETLKLFADLPALRAE